MAPAGLKRIGEGAFWGCAALWRAELGAGLEVLGSEGGGEDSESVRGAFEGCGLLEVSVPGSVGVVGTRAFCGCSGLCAAVLGEGVRELGDECFRWAALRALTVPASVRRVGAGAFRDCRRLGALRITGADVEVGEGVLAGTPLDAGA